VVGQKKKDMSGNVNNENAETASSWGQADKKLKRDGGRKTKMVSVRVGRAPRWGEQGGRRVRKNGEKALVK